jgi:UV DNA damage repair endonuclease
MTNRSHLRTKSFLSVIRQLTYKIKGSLSNENDEIHWESYDILL